MIRTLVESALAMVVEVPDPYLCFHKSFRETLETPENQSNEEKSIYARRVDGRYLDHRTPDGPVASSPFVGHEKRQVQEGDGPASWSASDHGRLRQ